jgi:CheY-like chemotaxis protein
VLTDVVQMAEVRARAKGLTLNVDRLGPLPARIRTDPRRLRQILINLLGNAVKFTDEGGVRLSVQLGGTPDNAWLQCAVSDTGIGMDEQQLARIFRPFVQGHEKIGARYGGTGLGLSISRQLAELLGGTLTAESRPGQGSTFRLTLPVGDVRDVPLLSADDAVAGARCSPPANAVAPSAFATANVAEPAAQALRILLAEDGPDNRRLITLVLQKAGIAATAVEDGQQACEAALAAREAGVPFDLILMDMQMPVLDGYAAARQLRAADYRGPIVALTAHAMHDDAQRCLDAGCDDYATKPIRRETLLALVARHATVNDRTPVSGVPS